MRAIMLLPLVLSLRSAAAMRGLFCLTGLLLFSFDPANGQDEAAASKGESLPPGALARLGSPGFRVPGPAFGARFLVGGKNLLVRVQRQRNSIVDTDNKGDFRVFDLDSGRQAQSLAVGVERHPGTLGE